MKHIQTICVRLVSRADRFEALFFLLLVNVVILLVAGDYNSYRTSASKNICVRQFFHARGSIHRRSTDSYHAGQRAIQVLQDNRSVLATAR